MSFDDFDFMDEDSVEESVSLEQELMDFLETQIKTLRSQAQDLEGTIEQSSGQVEQFRQRNMQVMATVQRIESQLDQTPRLNIRDAYSEALNVQQRLLNSQSQLDKLREQHDLLRSQISKIEEVKQMIMKIGSQDEDEQFNAREMLIRIIDAQETEREALAKRLHDGPAHSLTNFILQAEICQLLFDRDANKAKDELDNLKNKASDSFQQVRSFIFDLRPMMLSDLGLIPTMDRWVDNYREKFDIDVEYQSPPGSSRRLEGYREVLVFRGIQAIMTNARDIGATAVKVFLEMDDQTVRVTVEDNGRGLGTGELNLDSNNPEAVGLGTLQERITLVGGTLNVNSIPGGTRIEFQIPAGPQPDDSRVYEELV